MTSPPKKRLLRLTFAPLTIERWPDLEQLFGERGACGGCWCMSWRLKRSVWEEQKGLQNKRAFKRLVRTRQPIGVLAYTADVPVGWCAVGPRETLPFLERSRVLRAVDDKPVWSISCLFVERGNRRKGVSVRLLRAAIDYARSCGATTVEGYPTQPRTDSIPDAFAWTGIPSAFEQAGFKEVLRRSDTRPIMRYRLRPRRNSG